MQSPGLHPQMRQLSVESQAESELGQSPSSGVPPPVDLSSHPSRRRSQRVSEPIAYNKTPYENTTEVDSGIASQRSSMRSESETTQFEIEADQGSVDAVDEGVGDMEIFGLDEDHAHTHGLLQRADSVPHGGSSAHRAPNRSLTTSGCQPSLRMTEYMRMMNPRSNMVKDEYVLMHPAALSGHNHERSHVPAETEPRSLFPISEGKGHVKSQTIYENHELPPDAPFVDYSPNYENIGAIQRRKKYLHGYEMCDSDHQLKNGPHHLLSENQSSIARSISPPSNTRLVETGLYDIPSRHTRMDESRMASSPSPVIIDTP